MEKQEPTKESITESLKKYKEKKGVKNDFNEIDNVYPGANQVSNVRPDNIPSAPFQGFNQSQFEATMSKETDPDLMMSFEVVPLPSNGLHYRHGISELNVEYMTSIDEDLLTTPSLIENGSVMNMLLRRKIKTVGVDVDELLPGDRNAVILFLRTSSYGANYNVLVPDPRTGNPFKATVDLLQLKYKQISEKPDHNGHFTVEIPMRKKTVIIRLLSSGEENMIQKRAAAQQDAYGTEFSEFNTMKLKAHIVSINGKEDRTYIEKFVNVMPALDAYTIRKKILEVSPDVDMKYEFVTKDGYKFSANLEVGIDFFSPST